MEVEAVSVCVCLGAYIYVQMGREGSDKGWGVPKSGLQYTLSSLLKLKRLNQRWG